MEISRLLPKNRGFTLVECILSFGILVLLLAAAVPLWRMGLQIWQQESDILAVQQEQRIVLEMIARELRRARADSVEIVVDAGSGQPALSFEVDEEREIPAKVSYLQDRATANLIRRKDNGAGAGTNVYFTKLNTENGFTFAFVDPLTGSKRQEIGCRLSGYEVIELVLRSGQLDRAYIMQTRVAPRN